MSLTKGNEWIIDEITFARVIKSYRRKPDYKTQLMLKDVFVSGDNYTDIYRKFNVSRQLLYKKVCRFREVAEKECNLSL